jgi:hypothetical protein
MRRLLLSFLIGIACASLSHAQFLQQRPLPAKAERGILGEGQPLPMVAIGSKVLRLSPGALIFDRNNRTILHQALPPGADVIFTRDANGDIQRIYILTEQEQARLDQAPRR